VRRIIPASLACALFLWPLVTHARELERGEATVSVQSSLLRTDSDFFTNNQSENDFILNFRQGTIDFGELEADFVTSNIETRWKVGQFRVGIREMWVNGNANADFEVGDVNLDFRTVPSFFTNFILPTAPIRAFSARVRGRRLFADFFTGWFTERDGYLGNAFTRQNEFCAGFNFGAHLPRDSFLGGGFIRTEKERTNTDQLVNDNNNLLLLDARLGLSKNLSILGEYLYSYYDTAAAGTKSGQILVAGPSYELPNKLTIKANYRNLGKNFYYLSRSYQTVNNQEGVYLYADYTEPELLYLYGSGDFYWMQPITNISSNLIYNWAGNVGATFYPHRNWYVNVGSNFFKKYTNGPTLLSEGLRYEVFGGASGSVMQGELNLYARMRYRENRIERPDNVERNPDGVLGARWHINRRLSMQFETENEAQWDDRGRKDLIISRFKYYVDWRPLSFIYMTPGIEFTHTFDRMGSQDRDQLTLSLNYGHEFRHGFSILSSVQWTKGWGYFSDSYLDLFVNLQKVFRWGRPHMRIGIPSKDLPKVSGTIKGYLFIDENGDRRRQPWEKGIANMPIILDRGFMVNTDAKGHYVLENVLIGERLVAIDMSALPLEYLPFEIKHKVKVHVRTTAEVDFPVREVGMESVNLSDASERVGQSYR
jgi:hypothetical protein